MVKNLPKDKSLQKYHTLFAPVGQGENRFWKNVSHLGQTAQTSLQIFSQTA